MPIGDLHIHQAIHTRGVPWKTSPQKKLEAARKLGEVRRQWDIYKSYCKANDPANMTAEEYRAVLDRELAAS